MNSSRLDDLSLIEQIIQRNQAALSQLYDRYARIMYAVALKMLGSPEEAEEVVLDVFAQVWKTGNAYRAERGRVDGWLFMMTRSRTLDRLRARQRRDKVVHASTEDAQVQSMSAGNGPEENLLIQDRRDRVLAALAKIPQEQRLVLELAYYGGLSQSEIASQTGLALGTIKTRIRLGLGKLRCILESNEL
jgi:RNA polymerase sigma-70 factor, ECF subfamily